MYDLNHVDRLAAHEVQEGFASIVIKTMLDPARPCPCSSGKNAAECCIPIFTAARKSKRTASRRVLVISSDQQFINVAIHPHVTAYVDELLRGHQIHGADSAHKQTFPGNPLSITKDQHIVGRAHLEMFSAGHKVEAFFFGSNPPMQRQSPKNRRFCANRTWSQNAERWMQVIEEAFYAVTRGAQESGLINDQFAVSEYWALCCARSAVAASPPGPVHLSGFQPDNYTDAMRDALEYTGSSIHSKKGDLVRAIADGAVSMLMDFLISHFIFRHKIKWGVVDTDPSAMVLPDCFGTIDVPIAPSVMLHGHVDCSTNTPPRERKKVDDAFIDRIIAPAKHFLVASSREQLKEIRQRRIERGDRV